MNLQVHLIQNIKDIDDVISRDSSIEQTILMVTHSNIDASYAERVILLKMGVYIMKYIVVKKVN